MHQDFSFKQSKAVSTVHYSLNEFDFCHAAFGNILSLMWAEICKNREHNLNALSTNDKRNIVCLIDEAHRFICMYHR